jgi:TRAP-type C4-dicarboxylate transport system substrate-binding protein
MRRLVLVILTIVLTVGLILGGCGTSATSPEAPSTPKTGSFAAPKTTGLTLAADEEPSHFISLSCIRWMEELAEFTRNRVAFTPHWGGSLLKADAMYDGIIEGVTDIGVTMPAYNKGRFPLAGAIELPLGYRDSVLASQVAYDVIRKFQPAELNNVHLLYVAAMGFPVLVSSKPVRTLEDMRDMKVGTDGNTAKIAEQLGGVPVSMSTTEVYDALQEGTIDCAMTNLDTVQQFKLAEVAKYMTDIHCVGYTSLHLVLMNINKWNSLPEEVQEEAFNERARKYSVITGEAWDQADKHAMNYALELGAEFIEMSPEEQDRWHAAMRPIIEDYIATLESEGLPGKEIVDYTEATISKWVKIFPK